MGRAVLTLAWRKRSKRAATASWIRGSQRQALKNSAANWESTRLHGQHWESEGSQEDSERFRLVIREYLDEMRKQGRINGELSIVVKDGKKERSCPSFPIARDALRPPMAM